MLYLEIPRNTAYNPMIYIPFFIVILIDKRGDKRGDTRRKERERTYDTKNDTKNAPNEKGYAPATLHHTTPAARTQHTTPHHRL